MIRTNFNTICTIRELLIMIFLRKYLAPIKMAQKNGPGGHLILSVYKEKETA